LGLLVLFYVITFPPIFPRPYRRYLLLCYSSIGHFRLSLGSSLATAAPFHAIF
jgi:hypothetical protein